MNAFYLNLQSTAESPACIRVQFKRPIPLEGAYECSLEELKTPEMADDKKVKYIRANFISPQLINNARRPFLRIIYDSSSSFSSQYREVDTSQLSEIEITIEDSDKELIKFSPGQFTSALLHFRKQDGIRMQ